MIVDSSALVALVMREPEWKPIFQKLVSEEHVGMGTPTLVETGIVLAARIGSDPRGLLARLLQEFGIVEVPFGEAHWRTAVDAFLRYGKGRHPAALNFGDCLSYSVAKLAGRPLLCKGNDFARTDLECV